jgi:hypothetical protein
MYRVTGWIFDLSSIEIKTVQIFLHNEFLQRFESVVNAYEEYKIAMNKINVEFDLKKCEFISQIN